MAVWCKTRNKTKDREMHRTKHLGSYYLMSNDTRSRHASHNPSFYTILHFIPSFASYCHIVKFMHSTFWLFHARTCIVQLWCIVIISCWDMHCIQVNNFWLFHGGVHFVYHYIISDYFMVCIVYLPNFWIILHWNMLCIQLWYFLINSCWYMNCIQ